MQISQNAIAPFLPFLHIPHHHLFNTCSSTFTGFEEVNRRVRGSIIGALVASRSPVVRYASVVGDMSDLTKLLEDHYAAIVATGTSGQGGGGGGGAQEAAADREKLVNALCAAVACGLENIFDLMMSYDDTCREQEQRASLSLVNVKDQGACFVCSPYTYASSSSSSSSSS